jgi:hypothetical protein
VQISLNCESGLTKLNSSVQTLLAQTFMLTISSDPSWSGTSTCTPSHQHLRWKPKHNRVSSKRRTQCQHKTHVGAHRRFPPEQQQLLSGTHLPLIDRHPSRTQILLRVPYPVLFRIHLARRIRTRVAPVIVVLQFSVCRRGRRSRVVDTGLEEDEGDGGDHGPSGFEGPVAPIVVPGKSTACRPSHHAIPNDQLMSIRENSTTARGKGEKERIVRLTTCTTYRSNAVPPNSPPCSHSSARP